MHDNLQNIDDRMVFIINDDVDLSLLMKTYFLRRECQVFISHSMDHALSTIGDIAPDVILIDPAPDENAKILVERILEKVPEVQLITNG